MNDDTFRINGVTYATSPVLSCGDYGGAGSIGRANINCILSDKSLSVDPIGYGFTSEIQDLNKRGIDSVADIVAFTHQGASYFGDGDWCAPDAFHAVGSYGSETVWLKLDNDGENETLNALADYPAIDDGAVSEVEMQWESEAFDSWLESDLIRTLDDDTQDKLHDMDNAARTDITFQAYRDAMETENEYPVPEYNGVYVDVDLIKGSFARHISEALA